MALNYNDIIKDENPLIRIKSEPTPFPMQKEDVALLKSMLNYVKNSQDEEKAQAQHLRPAVGIAAIQLGVPKKMLAIVLNDEEGCSEYALVNPKIISESIQKAFLEHGEGCLSVEGEHEGNILRSARIKVRAFDFLQNKEIVISASGYFAIVLQHEIDHFSGILFYDHIQKDNPFYAPHDAIII